MKNKFVSLRILVLLLFLYFTGFVLFIMMFPVENISVLGLIGLSFIMMAASFMLGFIKSVTISLFLIILIGGYMTYEVLINRSIFNIQHLFFLVSIPVGTFLMGSIDSIIKDMLKKCQHCLVIAEKMILTDEVTGFGNGKEFLKDLEIEMAKALRYKQALTIGIIEIQYYDDLIRMYDDNVNEVFGKLAEVINQVIRLEDTKYRIEDDKIAMILPFTNIKQSQVLKGRLKESLKKLEIESSNEVTRKFVITTKIGLLEYDSSITNHIEFKNLAEKELEYDV